jgi:dynein heavy chain 1
LGGKLNPIQLKNLESLTEHDQFKKVLDHIRHQEEKWLTFMNSEAPENEIPTGWEV